MDTLTHALSGALLARLIVVRTPVAAAASAHGSPGRVTAAWDRRPGAPPAWVCVLSGAVAAAFPDIDFVSSAGGPVFYLQQHRGITHSVLLLPLWALLVAWLMARLLPPKRHQPGAWKSLLPIVASGIALHLVGDWITQFGTVLLAPWSDRRFDLGAVFIIDLALSATLVVGLLLAALWPRQRWPAAFGLLACIGWIGLCWTGRQEALATGREQAVRLSISNPVVQVMPRPASPFNWTVTVFDPATDTYHLAHLNTRRTEPLVTDPDANFIRGFLQRFSAPYQPVGLAHRPQRCASFRDLRFDFPGGDAAPFRYGLCLSLDERGSAPAPFAPTAQRFRVVEGRIEML